MLKDIKKYVAFEVSEYLLQVKHIVPIKKSFSFQQVLDYVLPSVFMKMTGCLEHKLDMMSLHLAMNDEQWRQTTMRYNSKIPSSSEDITTIIEAIIAYVSNNFDPSYSCEIWTNRERLVASVQMTCKTLEEVGIADYLGTNYSVLKNSTNNLPDKLTIRSNKGNPKGEAFIKVVYNQTIRFRNIYAHNEESVYTEFSNPYKLSSDIAKYNNWCFRFTAVTYVDLLIRNLFGDYTKFIEKALLS